MTDARIKRKVGANEWDQISFWSQDALKIHEHALNPNDKIFTTYGFNTRYCFCGDTIVGVGNGKWIEHQAYSFSSEHITEVSGVNTHIVSNGEDQALGCCYGGNKVFYYKNGVGTDLIPSSSEYKYIGVQYVDGLWVLISTTNVYFSTDPANGFDSKVYTANNTAFAQLRYGDFVVTEDESSYHVRGVGFYGAYLDIVISKTTGAITDIDVYDGKIFGTNVCGLTKMDTVDGKGTGLCIFNYKTTGITITREYELEKYKTVDISGVKATGNNAIVGFECSDNVLCFGIVDKSGRQINIYMYDWSAETLIRVNSYSCTNNGAEVYAVDNKDYFVLYMQASGHPETKVLSSRNGINWWTNFGYIFKENVNRERFPVTTVIQQLNKTNKFGSGIYIGDSEDYITIDVGFTPKYITMVSKGAPENLKQYESSHKITDRYGDTWTFDSSSKEYSTIQAPEILIYQHFDFTSGKWYQSVVKAGGVITPYYQVGNCSWDGGKIVLGSTTEYANATNYLYNWQAVAY